MNLEKLIQYGEDTVQRYVRDLPDLKIGVNIFGDEFKYTDYTKWRSRVINYIDSQDPYMGIKVKELFKQFEIEYTTSAFSEVIGQLYVALDRINKYSSSQESTLSEIKSQHAANGNSNNSIDSKPDTTVESYNQGKNGKTSNSSQAKKQSNKTRVFIVHGHDKLLLSETEKFVMKLGFEPIILKDKPSKGMTIIEKFEEYSDVDFAIVLYTACDEGGQIHKNELKPRARQNVVFEHGYFISELGRNKVCALVQKGVEIPGDYSGVVYIQYDDNGKWRYDVAKEMQEVMPGVDLNKL